MRPMGVVDRFNAITRINNSARTGSLALSAHPASSVSDAAFFGGCADWGKRCGSQHRQPGAFHTVKRAQTRPGLNQCLRFWPSNLDRHVRPPVFLFLRGSVSPFLWPSKESPEARRASRGAGRESVRARVMIKSP